MDILNCGTISENNNAVLSKVRTSLVLGSGGHTAELLGLVGASAEMNYTTRGVNCEAACDNMKSLLALACLLLLIYTGQKLGPTVIQPKDLLPRSN